MNELNPAIYPPTSPYKDRSTGLLIFGILTIGLGCLAGLLDLVTLAGLAVSGRVPNSPPISFSSILPALIVYFVLGVALVWLGIGSIMARRWARALMLIFSWSWLVTGILSIGMTAFALPTMMANMSETTSAQGQKLPPGFMVGFLFFLFLFDGVVFVILPGIWTFFFSSRHVKATCEARDPVTRWTDACPLPVLALCLWLAFTVLVLVAMPFAANSVFPFFGIFVSGIVGTMVYLALAVLWGYAAWLLYHMNERGWWIILIAVGVFMVSTVVTYSLHSVDELYRLMGYPEAQIAQIQKMGLFAGNRMAWFTGFSMLPFLGYLLFIKRYFPAKA